MGGQRFHLVHGYPGEGHETRIWGRVEPDNRSPFPDTICIVGHTPTVFLTDGHDEDFSIWHGDGILDIDCGCGSMKAAHILMVIRLVAQSDTPRLEFLPALPVDAQTSAGSRQGAVLKAPAHVVEQAGNCQHDRGRSNIIVPLQKELGVLISLSGPAEPHYCLDLIRLNTLPSQIQLSQHILGILVSRLR